MYVLSTWRLKVPFQTCKIPCKMISWLGITLKKINEKDPSVLRWEESDINDQINTAIKELRGEQPSNMQDKLVHISNPCLFRFSLNCCGKGIKPLFLRRRLGVLAALPILTFSVFPFISPIFSHFSLIWCRLASPYTRLGVSKGADRLTSPCRLKNIASNNN
jgi:hypothetical protein